jgi:hypothetical protein
LTAGIFRKSTKERPKIAITLIERKSRMPQIRGIQGRSRSILLRALGNEGDGVLSAFPQGKQNGILLKFYISWIEVL